MKKLISLIIIFAICSTLAVPAAAITGQPEIAAKSAVLMEKETGTIIFEKNAHEKLAPASVTKIMTLLLVMEALKNGSLSIDDNITISAHAASMGGSQVFLEEGEQMKGEDLIKAVIISSANDAAVALAERVAGSENIFVERMNEKAAQLGMNDTHFENSTGLDAEGHVTSAYDIALMSRALLKYDHVKKYSTIWMDSLRNGAFGLTSTNKLIKTYSGITGLKTGFTKTAMYCMSATAERDGMELISAVMCAPTSPERFESAKILLDFGFANYALADLNPDEKLQPVNVILGKNSLVQPEIGNGSKILIEKSQIKSLKKSITVVESIEAPVEAGQKLGEMIVEANGEKLAAIPIVASESIAKMTWGDVFAKFSNMIFMGS
jgi:D-alanyl-D-alanine carboxypeptidase (penicillin-binding protein 5/6)